eukprot:TRINITY_DN12358_c1_g3_i20.p1 TRINITY_DN12358_c1_g3~~TRINITY_DN12358_c1_g3_i20.p1  ORF type:complete len:280 (+),score=35.91 TRINITY_DN12358_c1_g3_i20:128-967(+)
MALSTPLELIMFLFLLAFVIQSPAFVSFLQQRICEEMYPNAGDDSHECNSGKVTSRASEWSLYLQLVQVVPAVFVSTAMGAFSDKIGRKPCLVLALAGTFAYQASVVVVILADLNFRWIFVGEAVAGLCGSQALAFMALFASLVDSIAIEDRTMRIGIMEGCVYLGLVLGYLLSGTLTERFGYTTVFISVGAMLAVTLLLVLARPETLKPEHRRAHVSLTEANVVSAAAILVDWHHSLRVCSSTVPHHNFPATALLFGLNFAFLHPLTLFLTPSKTMAP